jgi:hypothetical protein
MKRLTYISGFAFTLCYTMGYLFKLMHWPGANVMLFSGLTGAAVIFAPLLLINYFKSPLNTVPMERTKWILGALSIVLFALASWMKHGHLMGANVVLIISFLTLGFGFLPALFLSMYKKSLA